MPAPSALSPPASRTPQGANTRQQVPFIRATKKHTESFYDFTAAPSTTLSPINIPAYGFLRGVWVRVDAVGALGTTTSATYAQTADNPWNVLSFLGLFDVNGAPLWGPFSNGYNAFEITKYGGYLGSQDQQSGDYAVPTSGLFRFWFYIPVEMIRRNALGALANLNAAATYKLQMSVGSATSPYLVAPSTVPTGFRIRMWLDAWTQPPQTDLLGNMTTQAPNNHGTTQFWSEQVYTISSGQQTVRLVRVGLYIRELIVTLRNSSGSRFPTNQATADAMWADPVSLYLDGFELQNVSQNRFWNDGYSYWKYSPNTPDTAGNRDTSVYVWQFNDDFTSGVGEELRNRYLPTLQSSRLEIRGSFGTGASQLSVMTNDIAPAGDIFADQFAVL
jgi:hypothetical protein